MTTDAKDVAFAGGSLIVRLTNGRVQVRDASDGRLVHEAPGLPRAVLRQADDERPDDRRSHYGRHHPVGRRGQWFPDLQLSTRPKLRRSEGRPGVFPGRRIARRRSAAMERLARPLGRGRVQARWPGPDAGRVGRSGRLGKSRPALPSVRRTRPDAPAPSGSTTRVKQTPAAAVRHPLDRPAGRVIDPRRHGRQDRDVVPPGIGGDLRQEPRRPAASLAICFLTPRTPVTGSFATSSVSRLP